MQYIEQPAFETNEFKMGDKVRIYVATNTIDDEVLKLYDQFIVIDFADGVQKHYHFKQCRLLKKRETREWWLRTDQPVWTVWDHQTLATTEWIRVREVFEE